MDISAEGIAVGIYSLCAGMKPRKTGFNYTPKGKSLDFERYRVSADRMYFDNAAE